jgi:RNA polymerase sigma factor (sigma-70 family)
VTTRSCQAYAVEDRAVLLEGLRAGDRDAWDTVTERYADVVQAVVSTYRLRHADAADAIQNTWLRLLEHAGTIREPEKLGSWLATTARRECLALIRRSSSETSLESLQMDPPTTETSPEDLTIRRESRRMVQQALGELAERHQKLIGALYYDPRKLMYAAVARNLQMPIGSIGPTRIRALRILRGRLADRVAHQES